MTFKEIYQKYITREGADKLLAWLEGTDFFTAPASTRFHGDHEGGLVEHSVYVFEHLCKMLRAYPDVKCTAETAAIVSLLHDLCKIGCYKVELRNVKKGNVWTHVPFYKFEEDFSYGGHGSKSVFLVSRFLRLTDEEAIAINCHMGFADRPTGDYSIGSAYAQYPLAWLVHVADEAATYISESKEQGGN